MQKINIGPKMEKLYYDKKTLLSLDVLQILGNNNNK